jgi:hypothetical protein
LATAARINFPRFEGILLKSDPGTPHAAPRQTGPKARLLMSGDYYAFFGQILIGGGVVLSLAVVVDLARLKLAEWRKQRLMAERGERFGLIQEVIATGIPPAKRAARTSKAASLAPANASVEDSSARRWTIPGRTGGFTFQWN